MKARQNSEKSEMMAWVLNNPECMWEKDTAKTMTKYNVTNKQPNGSKNTKPKLQ